jgi:molybdopterin molybdotransferase
VLELEQGLSNILAVIPPPLPETVPLTAATGRVLLDPIISRIDLPPFDNSAVDGYAVRAADVTGAKTDLPSRLRLQGRVAAGESFASNLENGACIRLFTGSPLPQGADAVVMQEDTRPDAHHPERILVFDAVKPWDNVRLRGEEIKAGKSLGRAGTKVGIGLTSLIAAAGIKEVVVGRRPLVGVLATGSELREPGQPLAPGQIYESNRIGLAALLNRASCIPRIFPLVVDIEGAVRASLEQAFSECDAVITSGGVSVGEFDFIKSALESAGGELEFWRVAIKPGRPFVFGRYKGKFLFGLPGNPVSALVTFLLLVRPALLRWQGAVDISLGARLGILAEPMSNRGQRRHFMRVKADLAGNVSSAGVQASHVLSSMADANGLLDVPPETHLPTGTPVKVLMWD